MSEKRSPSRKPLVLLSLGLFVCAVAEVQSAEQRADVPKAGRQVIEDPVLAAEQLKAKLSDAAKTMGEIQKTMQVDYIARRLPGNESVWYVLDFQARLGNKKIRTVAIASGKITAAKVVVQFLKDNPKIAQNPQSYSRWLRLEMYANAGLAEARYRALVDHARRSGLR
jgi:hypothetical protein